MMLNPKNHTQLRNTSLLQDAGIYRSGETVFLSINPAFTGGAVTPSIDVEPSCPCPKDLAHLVLKTKRAMLLGKAPSLADDGTGGCYFFPDPLGVPVLVFKVTAATFRPAVYIF